MEYPAKIILFGEYGIILNSKALAIPYPKYSGRFVMQENVGIEFSKNAAESNVALADLNNYFKAEKDNFKFLELEKFESDIRNGLYFDSTIPLGSGLGSSGALTAALYDRYRNQNHNDDLQLIKSKLAAIESCFHGKSSGTDPFICWINKPLLLENHFELNTDINLSPFFETYAVFLINSHTVGNTGALVAYFMEQYEQPDFKEKIDHQYLPIINQTIDAVIAADYSTFEQLIVEYSQFQLNHFKQMIAPDMTNYFKHGNESGDFHLKICGSGGGGFVLGFSNKPEVAKAYFNLNHLDYTIVNIVY